jgi:hypothetical protein
MGLFTTADKLNPGDMYRLPEAAAPDTLFLAKDIRPVKPDAAFAVVEAQRFNPGGTSSVVTMSMRVEQLIDVLDSVSLHEVCESLKYIHGGDALKVYRADGRFWL